MTPTLEIDRKEYILYSVHFKRDGTINFFEYENISKNGVKYSDELYCSNSKKIKMVAYNHYIVSTEE